MQHVNRPRDGVAVAQRQPFKEVRRAAQHAAHRVVEVVDQRWSGPHILVPVAASDRVGDLFDAPTALADSVGPELFGETARDDRLARPSGSGSVSGSNSTTLRVPSEQFAVLGVPGRR